MPRFTGIVELPGDLCTDHHAGEFGYATIRATQSTTVVQVLNHRISQWLDNKLAEARKSTGKAT